MGHIGAGKSTILKLVERFHEPQQGPVKINGIDINEYAIETVRERIGFVSQDPFMFYGDIRSNVAYAREATMDDEIHKAPRDCRGLGIRLSVVRRYRYHGRGQRSDALRRTAC